MITDCFKSCDVCKEYTLICRHHVLGAEFGDVITDFLRAVLFVRNINRHHQECQDSIVCYMPQE